MLCSRRALPGHNSATKHIGDIGGPMAIKRFLRPVVCQNVPGDLLPGPLKDANPLHIWRTVEGELTREPIAAQGM